MPPVAPGARYSRLSPIRAKGREGTVPGMGVADKLRELRWRARGHYTRPLPTAFLEPLRGARALEVGGPSHVFSSKGLLPAYDICAAVDGVQFAADTIWHGEQGAGPFAPQPGP